MTQFQQDLADIHYVIGDLLSTSGDTAAARVAHGKALAIRQKLAQANPSITHFQQHLAVSHRRIGLLLMNTGDPAGAGLNTARHWPSARSWPRPTPV